MKPILKKMLNYQNDQMGWDRSQRTPSIRWHLRSRQIFAEYGRNYRRISKNLGTRYSFPEHPRIWWATHKDALRTWDEVKQALKYRFWNREQLEPEMQTDLPRHATVQWKIRPQDTHSTVRGTVAGYGDTLSLLGSGITLFSGPNPKSLVYTTGNQMTDLRLADTGRSISQRLLIRK
jgi:hypothetical protein